jgi:hypothetical protein
MRKFDFLSSFLWLFQMKEVSRFQSRLWLGVVAHACNCSCLEGSGQEDHSLKPAWAKRLWDPFSTGGWVWWRFLVTQVTQRSTDRRIMIQAGSGRVRPYLKNRPCLGVDTSGRGDYIRKGCRRVNLVKILWTHTWKWKNETCWNYSRNGRRGE